MSDEAIHGHHKVAAFLLGLDGQVAASILKNMSDDVVDQVAEAMMELDPRLSKKGAVDGLYSDLARSLNGPKQVRSCDTDELASILGDTFGRQKADAVVDGILARRRRSKPFLAIETFPAAAIHRALAPESGAVAALVLAHLDPSVSAEVIKQYENEDAVVIVRRMATLNPPNAAVLQMIAEDLESKIGDGADAPVPDASDRLKKIADLLNFSKPDLEKGVIESLSEDDADMAQELREYMFTWEDIASIDKRSMQKILGTVDTKTLSVALKACSAEVEENVLGNLSSRVKDMVAEERDLAGPVPMTEVTACRNEIMKSIRALIESGEFSPSRGGEDLVT